MKNKNDGYKFILAEAKNFKGIAAKTVEMNGKSMMILGGNGQDKSSLIQILKSSVDARFLPEKPLSDNEDKGSFKVVIAGSTDGVENEYTIEYLFTKKNGKGTITVTDGNGENVKTPKTIIENLIGDISFDVFKFIKDPKGKQVEVLKRLTGKGEEIDAIEAAKKVLLAEKNKKASDCDFFERTIGEHKYSPEEVEKYENPHEIKEEDKKKEVNLLAISTDNWNRVKNGIKLRKESIVSLNKSIADKEAAIKKALEDIECTKKDIAHAKESIIVNETGIAGGVKWLSERTEPSVKAINEELEAIREHNKHYETLKALSEKHLSLIAMKQEIETISGKIKDKETERSTLISKSKLPVEGLSFDDNDVYYNKLPLSELQINKAKLITIGASIGMALNPNFKVMFIGDGSLLDHESLDFIIELAESNGYQVIIEMVRPEGGPLSVEFIEESIGKK